MAREGDGRIRVRHQRGQQSHRELRELVAEVVDDGATPVERTIEHSRRLDRFGLEVDGRPEPLVATTPTSGDGLASVPSSTRSCLGLQDGLR